MKQPEGDVREMTRQQTTEAYMYVEVRNVRGGIWRRWESWKDVFSEERIRERECFGGVVFI
jgi:hypothetical protein